MEVLAKGQLSYLILSCLQDRDMYGLELITEIKERSGIDIKLPSLYSNLNRMKELKYISSYLKESTKGPKCAYSSITEAGREELVRLKELFADSFAAKQEPKEAVNENLKEESSVDVSAFEDYDDYFVQPEEEDDTPSVPIEESEAEQEITTDEEEIIEEEPQAEVLTTPVQEKIEVETEINDAVFLPKEEKIEVDENTQRLYNASREYSSRANAKKIPENQIGLVAATAPSLSKEQTQAKMDNNIENLKQALLETKQGHYEEVKLETATEETLEPTEAIEEEKKDDGVFITETVDYIPRSRRIDPPRINILPVAQKDLPAPRRDANIDPNCSDVKARIEKLYAKSEEPVKEAKQSEPKKLEVGFAGYSDLQEYYASQNVSFKIYKRSERKPSHNTNKIIFFVDLFMLGAVGLGCGLLYLIFNQLGLVRAETNFLYYLFPILYFVYTAIRFAIYKKSPGNVPKPLFNWIIVWGSLIILSGLTLGFNLAAGIPIVDVLQNSTTLFLPIFMFIVILILRHYTLLFSLKKFWK